MIYALGLMSDGTFACFTAQAAARGIDVIAVDLRDAVAGAWAFPAGSGGPAQLHLQDRSVDLQPDGGFFCRIINLASTVPYHASQMYAKNLTNFLLHIVKDGKLVLNLDDEITRSTCSICSSKSG